MMKRAGIAQQQERRVPDPEVAGTNPAPRSTDAGGTDAPPRAAGVTLLLEPAAIYALQQLVACGRLYVFGASARLDRPAADGSLHMISLRQAKRLERAGLARVRSDRCVPGSTGMVDETRAAPYWCWQFGWPTVWREWNEMPQVAEHTNG
jgi:hypothetical protein